MERRPVWTGDKEKGKERVKNVKKQRDQEMRWCHAEQVIEDSVRMKKSHVMMVKYLRESEWVRDRVDQNLTQFAIQVRAFDAVQVSVHPEDPTHKSMWPESLHLLIVNNKELKPVTVSAIKYINSATVWG